MSSALITWPAPASEVASPDYTLTVNGTAVFVYQACVRSQIHEHPGLWTHTQNCAAERTSFAIFDMAGPVSLAIRPQRTFTSATVLPSRAALTPEVSDGAIYVHLLKPTHLTVLLDGSDENPLHLFIGEPEIDAPKPGDPQVIYFGPGVHETNGIHVRSGQTIYLAGGAVVKAKLMPETKPEVSDKWKVDIYNGAALDIRDVHDVRIAGRGILDGTLIPHPGWNLIPIERSQRVNIEGIVLRDAPNWNIRILESEDVTVKNVRIVSGRLNSDGINSVSSRRVSIRGCFVRNLDDGIVAKATVQNSPCEDILVEDCQLWSDWGYATGVTYETRSPVRRVRFERCDILFVRHWCMGVYVSDGSTVSDVLFHDIRVANVASYISCGGSYIQALIKRPPILMRLGIASDVWANDTERGQIRHVVFHDVTVDGTSLPPSEFFGHDAEHTVDGVLLRHIQLNGRPPVIDSQGLRLTTNAFVHNVTIQP